MIIVQPLRLVFFLTFIVTVWYLVHQVDIFGHIVSRFALNVEGPRFDARLHPESHARRPAKTLELNWVIRQELRSPDGVQKSVYTVNGPRYGVLSFFVDMVDSLV